MGKRKKLLCLILAVSFSVFTKYSFAKVDDSINISINGENVNFNSESGFPFVDSNKRIQVPFRATLEKFGAEVYWDSETNIAIAKKDGIEIKVSIGEKYIYKNGEKIDNDTEAEIKDNRTYLPIRVVMEAFGCDVDWIQKTKTVVIKSNIDIVNEENEVFNEELNDSNKVTIHIPDLPNSKLAILDYGDYESLFNVGHHNDSRLIKEFLSKYVSDSVIEDINLSFGTKSATSNFINLFNDFTINKIRYYDEDKFDEINIDYDYMSLFASLDKYHTYQDFGGIHINYLNSIIPVYDIPQLSSINRKGYQAVFSSVNSYSPIIDTRTMIFIDDFNMAILGAQRTYEDRYSSSPYYMDNQEIVMVQSLTDLNEGSFLALASAQPQVLIVNVPKEEILKNKSHLDRLKIICPKIFVSSLDGDIKIEVYEDYFQVSTDSRHYSSRKNPEVYLESLEEIDADFFGIDEHETITFYQQRYDADLSYLVDPDELMKTVYIHPNKLPSKYRNFSQISIYQLRDSKASKLIYGKTGYMVEGAFKHLRTDQVTVSKGMQMYPEHIDSTGEIGYLAGDSHHIVLQDFITISIIYDRNGIPVAYSYINLNDLYLNMDDYKSFDILISRPVYSFEEAKDLGINVTTEIDGTKVEYTGVELIFSYVNIKDGGKIQTEEIYAPEEAIVTFEYNGQHFVALDEEVSMLSKDDYIELEELKCVEPTFLWVKDSYDTGEFIFKKIYLIHSEMPSIMKESAYFRLFRVDPEDDIKFEQRYGQFKLKGSLYRINIDSTYLNGKSSSVFYLTNAVEKYWTDDFKEGLPEEFLTILVAYNKSGYPLAYSFIKEPDM